MTALEARGCTAFRWAWLAISTGLIISCSPAAPDITNSASGNSTSEYRPVKARNVYSPEFASDPYVIEEQRRVAQALRLSCEQFKTHCHEAEQAERFIAEADARR